MTSETVRPDLREGPKRETVRRALARTDGFVSAQQLHLEINAGGDSIGLATVYRHLGALAEQGDADTISVASGQLFRTCTRPGAHHHHLICDSCGTAADIAPADEEWIRTAAREHGFTVTHHRIEVFGRCRECLDSE
ncbi:Fur family transcriptional regulator [Microbacterium xanthum]|uniref:Fur family transcriptional regulator n=1 Tax=Microbacterium xanthum TaxID=3079794 RepID=UPI002AD2BE18|nr:MULTISPECIES: transcriptional repressor [unclassified Microbacterium]MDZ8171766.1 transcriptional repressor [Microbacterium sp. KSW-48]MDZ8200131.1 transcriptional repressor [Microbacterium sp. SSW1-59]